LVGAGLFAIACVRRSKIAVSQSLLKDSVGDLPVQGQTFGLLIFLVPPQVEPAQPFENRIDGSIGIAFGIGIIEPEDHGSSVVAGVEPVKDEGARTTNVQKTGRRWGESDAKHNV